MKKFHFTLQPISQLRESQEQEALRAHGHAIRERTAAAASLAAAHHELEQFCELQRGRTTALASEFIRDCAWAAVIEQKRKRAAADLEMAQNRASDTQARLLAARRDRDALDRLRRKQRAGYDRRASTAEQAFLDDLAVMRHDVKENA